MTDPTPTITVTGDEKAAADLLALGTRAEDIRATANDVKAIFHRAEEAVFASEGPGWPPLAEETRRIKSQTGRDPRLMRATGALYASLTAPAAANQYDARAPQALAFGTTVWYARFHQKGEGVPKRPLTKLQLKYRREIKLAMQGYIAHGKT